MNILIVHNKKGSPSAKALSKALREILSHSCYIRRGNPNGKTLKERLWSVIINVGNSDAIKSNELIINLPSSVRLSVNKRRARLRFKAREIPAPSLWTNPNKIPTKEYPVIGRKTYHMKGRGFWLCKNIKEAINSKRRGATHWIKYIDNTREYRVHVFSTKAAPKRESHFEVIKISEKVLDPSSLAATKKVKQTIIKNHENGYIFTTPKDLYNLHYSDIKRVAIKAIKEFGLHFGAVDIMYSKSSNKIFVLEINTSPCLTDELSNTLHLYSSSLQKIITNES